MERKSLSIDRNTIGCALALAPHFDFYVPNKKRDTASNERAPKKRNEKKRKEMKTGGDRVSIFFIFVSFPSHRAHSV